MASNVTIQKQNGPNAPALARPAAWDPFQSMRELFRWDPFQFGTLMPLQGEGGFAPDFEVKENKESFIFKADLPGVAEKDLHVQFTGNRLSVSGKRESERTEQNDTYYATERSYGSFTRSFALPEGVDADKAHAELKDGVLSIAVPKRPEAQPRKISVTSK